MPPTFTKGEHEINFTASDITAFFWLSCHFSKLSTIKEKKRDIHGEKRE